MVALAPGGIKLIAIASIFEFLAISTVGLRIWARRLNRKQLDASDWLILASLLVTSTLTAIIFAGVVIGGAGHHQSDVTSGGSSTKALDQAAKIVFIAQMFWLLTNALTKISTLAFYLGIFRVQRFRYVVFGVMGLTIASLIAFVVKDFLICQPVERNWTFEGDNCCGITAGGTIATGVGITVVDVLIVILPMPLVLGLQMRLAKKLMICAIFSLGLVVCIISGLRLDSVLQIDYKDLTYSIVPLGIYTLLEPLLGIIAASLPTLQPVMARVFKSEMFNWTRRGSRKGSASTLGRKRSLGTSGSSTLRGTGTDTKNTDTRNFNRLYDHLYPMTTMSTMATEEPGSPRSIMHNRQSGISVKGLGIDMGNPAAIVEETEMRNLTSNTAPSVGTRAGSDSRTRSMRFDNEQMLSRLQTVQEEGPDFDPHAMAFHNEMALQRERRHLSSSTPAVSSSTPAVSSLDSDLQHHVDDLQYMGPISPLSMHAPRKF